VAVSADGDHVLLYGPSKAIVLGPQGDPKATVDISSVTHGAISKSGRFVLVSEGGVTLHNAEGREIGRLAAFGKVNDVALSADGRHLALATTLASSVYDAVDGRTLWSTDGAATRVAYDPSDKLFVERAKKNPPADGPATEVVQVDWTNGAVKGPGQIPVPPTFLPDGCLHVSDGSFCPSGVGGAGIERPDGTLWLLNGGLLDRWTPMTEGEVAPMGSDGGAAVSSLAWMGSADLLVARIDGHLERHGADGAIAADVMIPGCSPCQPLGIGADPDGGIWAVGTDGSWMTWDAGGQPTIASPKSADLVAVKRLADGRWVSLGSDGRARLGKSPGKGAATKPMPGAVGVDAAGEEIAVWTADKIQVYDASRKPLPPPDLGPGRKPVAVALSGDGSTLAVLDDGGALHAYRTRDGRAVFRVTAAVKGNQLQWGPGGLSILAGGDPLRMFSGSDGKEVLRVELSPDGPIEEIAVAPDGTLAVSHTTERGGRLRRVPWSTIAP
jgi:hypothetical protein